MATDLLNVLQTASEQVSQQSLQELVNLFWSTESRFSFPSFEATARHALARLREWGGPENAEAQPIKIRGRSFDLPADGRTILGDCKMPLGWNCASARLEIHDPIEERGQVLADFKKNPLQVIAWSGPTPPDGITAPVVRIESLSDIEAHAKDVRGRIVFTPSDPRPLKKRMVELGVGGVVTSYSPEAHHLPKACGWIASWSDDPQASAFVEGDRLLPGMVISPEQGVELEILMERGPVRLKLTIEAHYIEGTLPVVCGYIDAPLQEEILAIAHAFSPGANANISGAAVVMESLRVLQEATRSGILPPLRRGVRGLLTYPHVGIAGFGIQNPGILRRIHAGISWTGTGRYGEQTGVVFQHHAAPAANPTIADTLLILLMEAWLPRVLPHLQFHTDQPFAPLDNTLSDPRLNVPCPAVWGRDRLKDTSLDTPESLQTPALHAFATISVAYLHFLSTAGTPEAFWLSHQTLRRFGRKIEEAGAQYALRMLQTDGDKSALLTEACDHLMYLRSVCEATVMSSKRFMAREDKAQGHLALLKILRHMRRLVELEKRRLRELADAKESTPQPIAALGERNGYRPYRTFSGPPTYARLTPAQRGTLSIPDQDAPLQAALYYCEGKLTLADILRRVSYEFGRHITGELLPHLDLMAEHGMIKWLQPGEAVPRPQKPAVADEQESADSEPPADSTADEEADEPDDGNDADA